MNEYRPSSELDSIPLGTAAEERKRAAVWMDTAAQHLGNEKYWRKRAENAEAAFVAHSGQLFKDDEVIMNIPVRGTPKAIKDVLEKFDASLVPIYMKIAPNCWDHCHPDSVFINCSMDMQKNFKVLGLTKADPTSKYRNI